MNQTYEAAASFRYMTGLVSWLSHGPQPARLAGVLMSITLGTLASNLDSAQSLTLEEICEMRERFRRSHLLDLESYLGSHPALTLLHPVAGTGEPKLLVILDSLRKRWNSYLQCGTLETRSVFRT